MTNNKARDKDKGNPIEYPNDIQMTPWHKKGCITTQNFKSKDSLKLVVNISRYANMCVCARAQVKREEEKAPLQLYLQVQSNGQIAWVLYLSKKKKICMGIISQHRHYAYDLAPPCMQLATCFDKSCM